MDSHRLAIIISVRQERPEDSRVLIGERARGDILAAPLRQKRTYGVRSCIDTLRRLELLDGTALTH